MLASTLAMVATAMTDAQAPWRIIGSAAVALHGADPGPVSDVDILMSPADARRLAGRYCIPIGPGVSDGRFRSALFARWETPPVAVEIMAGLAILCPGGWHTVRPVTRQIVATDGDAVYVPERRDLVRILRAFGRPKDLRRAALLGDGSPM